MRVLGVVILAVLLGSSVSFSVLRHMAAGARPVLETGDYSEITAAYGSDVVLFTSKDCEFSSRARAFLIERSVPHLEVPVESSDDVAPYLKAHFGELYVPVLVGVDRRVGGFDPAAYADFIGAR